MRARSVRAVLGFAGLLLFTGLARPVAGQETQDTSYVIGGPDGEQQGSTETVWKRQEDGSWKVARLLVM